MQRRYMLVAQEVVTVPSWTDSRHLSGDALDRALREAAARRRLAIHRERIVIVDAALAGLSRTRIARLIGVSEPDVSRTLASVKAAHDGHLHPQSLAPLDVIDQRDAGEIDSTLMMERLRTISYTDGHVPMVAGIPTDVYVRGSWDDIEFAFQQDKLTFDEYSALFEAHRQQVKSGH